VKVVGMASGQMGLLWDRGRGANVASTTEVVKVATTAPVKTWRDLETERAGVVSWQWGN
jgi:hypothetical protein